MCEREILRDTGYVYMHMLIPALCVCPCLSTTVDTKSYNDRKGRTRTSRIKDWYRGRKREERAKKRKFRLFGAPLNTVFNNGQLPEILQVRTSLLWYSTCT